MFVFKAAMYSPDAVVAIIIALNYPDWQVLRSLDLSDPDSRLRPIRNIRFEKSLIPGIDSG
jgi:hypothetical protein